MERLPVVEVVQVHRTGVYGTGFLRTAFLEDALANVIRMDVTGDRRVHAEDVRLVELHARIALYPFLKLQVGRLLLADEGARLFRIDPESLQHHVIVARADVLVAVGEFAGGTQESLQPQAGKMQDAERAGG